MIIPIRNTVFVMNLNTFKMIAITNNISIKDKSMFSPPSLNLPCLC